MKAGTENRKKTIAVGVLGTVALLAFLWQAWGLFGGSSAPPTPPPSVIPATSTATTTSSARSVSTAAESENGTKGVLGAAPGVAATKLAQTSEGLDPTLHEDAMLRTERLEYSGSGRNIFSATYTPAVLETPKNMPSPRVKKGPVVPPPPPPPTTCPPSCPPITLKFFGTEKFHDGKIEGFFLDGEDVYLAAPGDIVARKYKIVSILTGSAQVEDLSNTYTQTLPLQMQ